MKSVLRRRIVQCVLMVVALAAGWSASAAALPPLPPPPITLPTLTLPTVTVPPITTPVVTTPAVTTPTVPLPPQVPPAPKAPRVRLPAVPPPPSMLHRGTAGDPGPAGAGGSTDQSQQGARAETSREQASRFRLARDWISRRGPHGERRTTLVFILRRPALVEFVVLQVAPDCRSVGRFTIAPTPAFLVTQDPPALSDPMNPVIKDDVRRLDDPLGPYWIFVPTSYDETQGPP